MEVRHGLLGRVLAWAEQEGPIRAVVITGSLARGDGTADEFSDLDAQIVAEDYSRYIRDDGWLDGLGEVWIRFPLGGEGSYRLVWFAGGLKVDFQFVGVAAVREMVERGRLSDEYMRGYVVALDKDGLYGGLGTSPRVFPQSGPPSEEAVRGVINEFWFEAIHVAQFIRRREFWVVKERDWTMKGGLLRMLEWRARVMGEGVVNTWLLGRRMREWTDAESYRAVAGLWAGWDAGGLWDGLLGQMELFGRVSGDVCGALGYRYPMLPLGEIEAYIRGLRDEDGGG